VLLLEVRHLEDVLLAQRAQLLVERGLAVGP